MGVCMRSLVLWNVLLLVLPQGWCCLLSAKTTCLDEAPTNGTDCCHCCGGAKHKPSAPATPEPAKPFKTCCAQPALARSNAQIVHPELGPALPLIATLVHHAALSKSAQTSFCFHSHSPLLQLL